MYSQVEITAVKLVPGRNLTSVSSSKVTLGFDDVHLKRIDLQPHAWGEMWEGYATQWGGHLWLKALLYAHFIIIIYWLVSDLESLWSVPLIFPADFPCTGFSHHLKFWDEMCSGNMSSSLLIKPLRLRACGLSCYQDEWLRQEIAKLRVRRAGLAKHLCCHKGKCYILQFIANSNDKIHIMGICSWTL